MEAGGNVQPPDVGEALDRVAGVGKDDAVQERETAAEGVLQRTPDQRAAVGLKVGFGQPDLLPRTEEPEGVRPGGEDDLLRRIGTEGPDDLPAAFRLESFHIAVRIFQNLTALLDLLHQSLSSSRIEKIGSSVSCVLLFRSPT